WYLFSEQKKFNTQNTETHTVIINGEEIEIDYPLVRSFSNEQSNTDVERVASSTFSTSSVYNAAQSVAQGISQPFTFGLYYLNNILERGIDECVGRVSGE